MKSMDIVKSIKYNEQKEDILNEILEKIIKEYNSNLYGGSDFSNLITIDREILNKLEVKF